MKNRCKHEPLNPLVLLYLPLNPQSFMKKRILIINCYFPELRKPVKLSSEIPNTLAPVLLAGAFNDALCEIKIYNEVSSGFLEVYARDLLSWPDMVVLTGLTFSLDRLRQLTAYFRHLRPGVVIVGGGQAVRAFPKYAATFLDYACLGDVEQMVSVAKEVFGKDYGSMAMEPRYDLAYWMKYMVGYAESSRNCNFKCSFCSLTGEGGKFVKSDLDYMRRQIKAMGKRHFLYFLDNQFYGNDRALFLEKLKVLKELRKEGYFKYWCGILTNDFLWNDENILMAKESGCFSLFIGVESFDQDWLQLVSKKQNMRQEQVALIRKCMDVGILFQYGLVYDPTERPLESMRRELEYICSNPEVPTPLFFFAAIPFPGTPFFHDKLAKRHILPWTKVRDLESSTLSLRPVEGSLEASGAFIKDTKYFIGFRNRIMKHQMRFLVKHRSKLSLSQLMVTSLSTLRLFAPYAFANLRNLGSKPTQRTHISTTEALDSVYTPYMQMPQQYASYFQPTYLTDALGEPNALVRDDLVAVRYKSALTEA
jgi:hopanoid C-2 methylase